jgi:hypothetical protein
VNFDMAGKNNCQVLCVQHVTNMGTQWDSASVLMEVVKPVVRFGRAFYVVASLNVPSP